MEILILSGIIVAALILFIVRPFPVEITAALIVVALAVTGILSPQEALSGFSSTATVTVAAMFVLSAGLMRTGALEILTSQLGRFCHLDVRRLLLTLAFVVALPSAFVNNTPVVVIMVPVLLSICRGSGAPTSKVFIPISYFSILGGTCTLIGTSTNILIDDLYRKVGGPGFGIFDFLPFGLLYLLIGVVIIILLAPKLLPDRSSLAGLLMSERPATFVTEFVIRPDSPLIGKRVGEVFTKDCAVRLLELIRGEEIVFAGRATHMQIEPDDALIVEGRPKDISRFLAGSFGVQLASVIEDEHRVPMKTLQLRLVEAVVLPDSPFVGRKVRDLGLNRLYGVKVIAVQRHGRQHRYQIRAMRLHRGDVLLLQADEHGLLALRETGAVLIVEGVERTVARRERMHLAAVLMALVVLSTALLKIPLVVSALSGAVLMIVTGCLRMDEAVRSVDPATILLLAGTIPLGVAMQKTGLAGLIANSIGSDLIRSHPHVLVSSMYLAAAALTSVLSNNAAAVLLTPIALDIAAAMQVNPKTLLMAVAFGASASFATPIGYQTNAIVMGPGGYTFGDYLRIGIPLTIALWIAATFLVPVFWPL